ncbi:MAG: sulfite reductase flavoprotein subunit alpha [Saccharospirillaceae bacterium]|nr:sulfite reductase flavoprotein subunit alpha [Saccharospirillaceae bacterium]
MNDMVKKKDTAQQVPFLPQDIPFNDEQRQWMSGFLAGLHSRMLVQASAGGAAAAPTAAAQKPLTIMFGSQTGNSEAVAEEAADAARAQGLAPVVLDMEDVDVAQLPAMERLLIVTSTYGEGEMPDNAQALWDAVSADDAPKLDNTFFSVLALGDNNYDGFCVAGQMWDERLEQLGAQRIGDRVDCDVDFEAPSQAWIEAVVPVIAAKGSDAGAAAPAGGDGNTAPKKAKSKYSRSNPLEAELTCKKVLSGKGSSKEIMHFEFSLAGSGERYNAGDALNVIAENRPDLVDEVVAHFGVKTDDSVLWNDVPHKLGQLLTEGLEIRNPSKELIAELAQRNGDEELTRLLENDDNEALNDFLWGKDCVDLLKAYPCEISIEEFCALCKALAPRAYSISSSINAHAEEVHLTIGSVRYNQDGRDHNGVCSTFLADVANEGNKIKCYFSPNKNFAVPEDNNLPMIMVGPGTGIAPFRAFLEERQARGAQGDNWLFFGDRNKDNDFIYRDEIEAMQESGLLTKLDLAFSRDQAEKIYVQDRMRESGAELFAWLERGGYFYICGDAYRMAKDVDDALHQLIAEHGKLSPNDASEYVAKLKKEKRYVRDVY